jgi:hypothetical protein
MASGTGLGQPTERRGMNLPARGGRASCQPKTPCTGKLSRRPEGLPGFCIVPREFASIANLLARATGPLLAGSAHYSPSRGPSTLRFSGMTESIGPMWSEKQNHLNLGAGCRLPLVGPRAPVQGCDGRSASCSSSAMSSGRLFLDRVARQQSPSPLHRHPQNITRSSEAQAEGDISTLPGRGHFYFALTLNCLRLTGKETSTDNN